MGNYLALVNKNNRFLKEMVEGFEFVEITDNYGDPSFVEQRTYNAFLALQEKMKEKGINVSINSAGRTVEFQKKAFLDLEREFGTAYAHEHTALPNFSEHHTGLAIDVKLEREKPSLLSKLKIGNREDKAKMYACLHKELSNFGFILRYTKEKQEITGFPPERWHIRFVGKNNAKEIEESGLCLEEFLQDKDKVA